MVAQHRLIPALQMLLENPLLLIGAQQSDVLIAALNHQFGEFVHRRDVVDSNIHIQRIGAHRPHFHHRYRGVFQPVADGIRVFRAEQNGGRNVRGEQRFEQFLFLLRTVLRFGQHNLVSGRLQDLLQPGEHIGTSVFCKIGDDHGDGP